MIVILLRRLVAPVVVARILLAGRKDPKSGPL